MASSQPQPDADEEKGRMEERPPQQEDMLEKYLEIEEECCRAGDYVAMVNESACSPNLVWREMVCKWGYDVVDMLGEVRSVVYVAMNILDRYCAVVATIEAPMNEKWYECASMTALFLAARMAGTCNQSLQMSDLTYMSRDSVQLQDIISTGKRMLNVLTWGPRLITPVDFLQTMLKSLPTSIQETRRTSLFESASFLAEIAVCDIYLSRFPASQVAFAAILNAAQTEGLLSHSELESFCQAMEDKAALLHSSMDTRTVRGRLDSVYNRIEDNHQETNTTLHYISDDEEETPPTTRKRACSSDDDCHHHGCSQELPHSQPMEPPLDSTIDDVDQEREPKRTRRRSLSSDLS